MDKNNFLEALLETKKIVWPVIEKYLEDFTNFPEFCKVPKKYDSLVEFHKDLVSDYPKRKGKYLRPTLIMLVAQAMGISSDLAVNTAAAMQTSEDWILNHDDIEDDSLERRGLPSLHRIYGKELAINGGDALQILMWRILFQNFSLLGMEKGQKIFDEFCLILDRTILGQTVEIKWTQENKKNLTEDDIFFILESKTGFYTIAGPMRLGAILAGANSDQLEKIYKFGVLLGRSFQIIDDLLDLTSDFAGLKKQQGNDIFEGKKTLMLIHLYQNISASEKQKLEEIMTKTRDQKTPQEVGWVIDSMKKYSSLDYCKSKALEFAAQAKEIFETELTFLNREPYRSQLLEMIDFITTRDH